MTTESNPDYMFITQWLSPQALEKCKKRLGMFKWISQYADKLGMPEKYVNVAKIKERYRSKAECEKLSVYKLEWLLGEQDKVRIDGRIVLLKKEELIRPLEFEDLVTGRYLREA